MNKAGHIDPFTHAGSGIEVDEFTEGVNVEGHITTGSVIIVLLILKPWIEVLKDHYLNPGYSVAAFVFIVITFLAKVIAALFGVDAPDSS